MLKWFSRKQRASKNLPPSESIPTTAASTPTASSSRKKFPLGIKPLHDGEGSIVDIIFVHGLVEGREETWKTKSATSLWPNTLLPSKVPNARILAFGYDAYVTNWQGISSVNRIGDFARSLLAAVEMYRSYDHTNDRPIIFVCHCLGGLVCESALSIAEELPGEHSKQVLNCTRGIAFLGTPNTSSGIVHWVKSLAKAISVQEKFNNEILDVLKRDSEVLEQVPNRFHALLRSRFRHGLPPIAIACFSEELPLPSVGIVVPSHFAILPSYSPIGIKGDHMHMTKFEVEDDPGFIAISRKLRQWITELPQTENLRPFQLGTEDSEGRHAPQEAGTSTPGVTN